MLLPSPGHWLISLIELTPFDMQGIHSYGGRSLLIGLQGPSGVARLASQVD